MYRYSSIREAIEGVLKPKTIELSSELEPGKSYTIDGNGPFIYDHQFGHDTRGLTGYAFRNAETGEALSLLRTETEKLIDEGKVVQYLKKDDEIPSSIPDYPSLDRFTRNTFGESTLAIWERVRIREHMNKEELLTLETMLSKSSTTEMPLPNERGYESLLGNRHWSILKKYLKLIYPNIELPENLA